jgi:UDP-glucose 4-epimerase
LLEAGHRVEVVDNLLTGRESNLDAVRRDIVFHKVDIRDYEATERALCGVDVVYHLAAIPSVPRSISDPIPSHEVNINGTFHVLRAAQAGGARRVVYAASSSAYGDTPMLPKVETMQPNPKSPYATQKLLGEYYCSVFYSCFGLETVSLRFFNVYGPRQDPSSPYSGVLSLFMTAVLDRKAPTIFGDGEQTRDFTYVEDVVALVQKAAAAPATVCGKVYNAGNGGRYSLNHTWDLIQKIEGVRIAPQYGPPRAGDVRDSQADTTAASRDLGHQPRFSFEEGLRRTLEWYRATHGGSSQGEAR